MIKIEIQPERRSYFLTVTIAASVLVHIGLWAVLTEFGKRPIQESYLAKVIMQDKKELPTPEPEKKVDLKKLAEMATPPPIKEQDVKQLLEQKTIDQQIKAELKFDRKTEQQNIVNLSEQFNRRGGNNDNPAQMPSLVNTGGRGNGGDPGPAATSIRIGSGRKGGIGISSDGVGTVSINIGSGLGGGKGGGRGSGTGNGPDIATVRLGGVGLGNCRENCGGGGGGGGPVNVGTIGNSGRAKAAPPPVTVAIAPQQKAAAPQQTSVSGEWVVASVVGPIAGLQVKCLNNPGVHIYGNIKIQCENNQITMAWTRQ
jgi:hypothetical protein